MPVALALLQVLMTLMLWQYLVLRPLRHPIAPLVDYLPRATDGVPR
jgi:hypothetical protein